MGKCKKGKTAVDKIGDLLADGRKIDAAMKRAGRDAVRRHRLAGNPISVGRKGKVVWLAPPK
jgi:hypothetical protein